MSGRRWRLDTPANHAEFERFRESQERFRAEFTTPGEACPSCEHPWEAHKEVGCVARVDSAWTPSNSRPCGCSRQRQEA